MKKITLATRPMENHMKKYKDAIKDYEIAIRLDPKDNLAFSNRAKAKLDLEDYAGAITDYSLVIELNSRNSQSFQNRGVCYLVSEEVS